MNETRSLLADRCVLTTDRRCSELASRAGCAEVVPKRCQTRDGARRQAIVSMLGIEDRRGRHSPLNLGLALAPDMLLGPDERWVSRGTSFGLSKPAARMLGVQRQSAGAGSDQGGRDVFESENRVACRCYVGPSFARRHSERSTRRLTESASAPGGALHAGREDDAPRPRVRRAVVRPGGRNLPADDHTA